MKKLKGGRPTEQQKKEIIYRNKLIRIGLQWRLQQSEVARIFRVPRNTISIVARR